MRGVFKKTDYPTKVITNITNSNLQCTNYPKHTQHQACRKRQAIGGILSEW